jgi:hypothetical protein
VTGERLAVRLLCAAAAVRVLVYATAFPFFANIDEEAHYGTIVAYAEQGPPRALLRFDPATARVIAGYNSPEFFVPLEQMPDGLPPPLWEQPAAQAQATLERRAARWETRINHQSLALPLYYALAAGWLRAGQILSADPGWQLYWLRFLDVPLAAALVGIAWAVARQVFPAQRFARLAVPALIALLPQDAFHSIQSDVLSPLVFGLAFLGLVHFVRASRPGVGAAALTGLALAATALTKTTNLPLLAVAAAAFGVDALRRRSAGTLRTALPALAALVACAALPFGAWLLRNAIVLGDFTGSAAQAAAQDWTRKPIGAWWPHPLFTPSGFFLFWWEISVSLWRGELVWHAQRLAWRSADLLYWATTTLFLVAAALRLRPRAHAPSPERAPLVLALACFVASLAFLALLSLSFDFGSCPYPSRAHPYFSSGRYLSGALIPFALLYVYGLDACLARVRGDGLRFALLAAILLFATASEIAVNRVAFASPYNALSFP